MKSVCNGVAVIGYRECNGCNGFWTDTVKTRLDIIKYVIISMRLKLQSDHKGRLQSTRVVRVSFVIFGVLIDPKHITNWVVIKDVLRIPLPAVPGMDI